jgi:hypothetical protein
VASDDASSPTRTSSSTSWLSALVTASRTNGAWSRAGMQMLTSAAPIYLTFVAGSAWTGASEKTT